MPTTAERESARLAWRIGIGRGDPPEPEPEPEAPTAPVLSVESVVDTTVTLSFVVDETIGEGDYRQVQIQADGGDWTSTIVDSTAALTSGEAGASELEIDIPEPDEGTYDVRMRVREGDSGPWSGWSNVDEYVITASAPSYTHRGSDAIGGSGHVHTFAVDVGDATYVLIACSIQNADPDPVSVTYDGHALSKLAGVVNGGGIPCLYYGGVITAGSGARNAVVTWTSASFESKLMDVYSLHNLASTTVKATGTFSTGDVTVSVTNGDLLFQASRTTGQTTAMWDASSPAPSAKRIVGSPAQLGSADWLAASTGNIVIDTAVNDYGVYVVFA